MNTHEGRPGEGAARSVAGGTLPVSQPRQRGRSAVTAAWLGISPAALPYLRANRRGDKYGVIAAWIGQYPLTDERGYGFKSDAPRRKRTKAWSCTRAPVKPAKAFLWLPTEAVAA